MKPEVIKGGSYIDERGKLFYNNTFDATEIRRIYFIENSSVNFERGWQGHKIEQRWFTAVQGKFKINLIAIDDWENPNKLLEPFVFELEANAFNVLHTPQGYVSCIQALEENSKLMVMANYHLGEIQDEYRFDLQTFIRK